MANGRETSNVVAKEQGQIAKPTKGNATMYPVDYSATSITAPLHSAGNGKSEGRSPQQDTVIVLGAGIAGIAAAETLANAGRSVTLIDRDNRIGGTHRSHDIGPYTFDVGSIFYEDNGRIFALAPDQREECPVVSRDQRRIGQDGRLQHYPLEPRDLFAWPKLHLARAVVDLALNQLLTRRDGSLETICISRLGRTIYRDTGLQAYINRFHHVAPTEIDEEFFFSRMNFIERQTRPGTIARAVLRALRRKPVRSGHGPETVLRVRPETGFDTLFDPIRRRLEARGVVFALGQHLKHVAIGPDGARVVTQDTEYRGATVVSAIPADTLYGALFDEPSGLTSLDLITLFVSAGRIAPDVGNVLYNFHGQGRWKRATIYSRLYPNRPTDREFMSVEITLPPGKVPDPEAAFLDFSRHVCGLGHVHDVRLEGHELVRDSYPFYRLGNARRTTAILERIKQAGIVTIGRQGRFEYLPTSSGVIRRVLEELAAAQMTVPAIANVS